MLWRGRSGRPYAVPAALLSALALFVVLGCFRRVLEIQPPAGFFAATDIGIYVTLAGALLAFVGTLVRTSTRSHGRAPQ
jgi:hypothetical protein